MLATVLFAQGYCWMTGFGEQTFSGLFLTVSILATCFSALTVFSFGSNLDLTSGKSSFPVWLFKLPVPSIRLALIPTLAMIAAFAWGWIPAAKAMSLMSSNSQGVAEASLNYNLLFLPWLGLSAFGLWLQAIAWWPFRLAWLRMVCLAVLMTTIALLVSLGNVLDLGPWYPTLATLIPTATGFVAAITSAAKARHLNWRSEASSDRMIQSTEDGSNAKFVDPIARPFSSAVSAVAWRDWKQLGRAPIILMLMICLPMTLMVATLPLTIRFLAVLLFVPASLLAFVGPMLGKSRYWKDNYEMSAFLSGLPVSDDQFFRSRIFNTLKVSVCSFLCVTVVFLVWLIRSENRMQLEQLGSQDGASGGLIAAAWIAVGFYLALISPWCGLAIGLYGRKWLKRSVTLLCACGGLAAFSYFAIRSDSLFAKLSHLETRTEVFESLVSQIRICLWVLLVWKAFFTLVLIVWALRFRFVKDSCAMAWQVIESKPLLIWGGVLVVLCGLTVTGLCCLLKPLGVSIHDVALGTSLTFPFASLIACRLALDLNRHR
jgi:hypothetical protein